MHRDIKELRNVVNSDKEQPDIPHYITNNSDKRNTMGQINARTIVFRKYTPIGRIKRLDQEQQARQRMNISSIRYHHLYATFDKVAD